MFSKTLLLLFICCSLQGSASTSLEAPTQDSVTVYVFLHESCLISQYYTLPLRQLNEEFCHENIQFVGLFPNLSSKVENIQAFKEQYNIPFALETDYEKIKTRQFGATITPEVVVFNETQHQILYRGRIDDAYARVGKRKQVTSTSELRDALTAIANGQPVAVTETQAVGCYINMRQPTAN